MMDDTGREMVRLMAFISLAVIAVVMPFLLHVGVPEVPPWSACLIVFLCGWWMRSIGGHLWRDKDGEDA